MPLVLANEGDVFLLDCLLNQKPLPFVLYHLFANNHVPQKTDTVADYEELTLAGYAPIQITAGVWSVELSDEEGSAAFAPPATWFVTEDGPAYGYFVTDPSGDILLWAEYLPGGPWPFQAAGSTLRLIPSVSAD